RSRCEMLDQILAAARTSAPQSATRSAHRRRRQPGPLRWWPAGGRFRRGARRWSASAPAAAPAAAVAAVIAIAPALGPLIAPGPGAVITALRAARPPGRHVR